MKTVYFKPIADFADTNSIVNATYDMLKKLKKDEGLKLPETMPLKVHFGEMGNDTYIKPANFAGVKKFLKENNVNTCYIETNVLYMGSRTHTEDHLKTAAAHGFIDLPVVIADADANNPYNEIEINKKYFKTCKIGKCYADYSGFMVLAHFKGHMFAGYGGAIKQLGMGFASRSGKLNQHSQNVPLILKNKCIACGTCVKKCPVNAISLQGKAVIDPKKCIGCAYCSEVCPVAAIENDWGGSNFLEKLAEYAYAAALNKNNIYINFAGDITKECDCMGIHMKPVAKNIGVLVGTDPVAVDTATLDLLDKQENKKMFARGRTTLAYAESIGLGSSKYKLITI